MISALTGEVGIAASMPIYATLFKIHRFVFWYGSSHRMINRGMDRGKIILYLMIPFPIEFIEGRSIKMVGRTA